MLNENGQRELAYMVTVSDVVPIEGYDRVELAMIGGWSFVTGKGQFKKGDLAIYFESDSKVPEVAPFTEMEFLVKKHYKIKTQKMCKSISMGLLVTPEEFGWVVDTDPIDLKPFVRDMETGKHYFEGDFLTQRLNVTYAVEEDNRRKAPSADKYKKMAQRNPKKARTWWWKLLWKSKLGKKILFLFFGRHIHIRNWPDWVVKTDEERVENILIKNPDFLNERDENGNKILWVPTEKIDGTSTTFSMKRSKKSILKPNKNEFYVCSRNVVFDTPDKQCYYEKNYYTDMSQKYSVEEKLKKYLEEHSDIDWVTLQGETYGSGIQKRDYSMNDVDFMGFNFITSKDGRFDSREASKLMSTDDFCIPWVPIFEPMELPDTLEELREYVHSICSTVDGGMREGCVFRSLDGKRSFKCVDPEYILKYHG